MILKLLTRNNFRYRKWKEDKEDVQILALTTCSYEFTDARIVILAIMEASPAE